MMTTATKPYIVRVIFLTSDRLNRTNFSQIPGAWCEQLLRSELLVTDPLVMTVRKEFTQYVPIQIQPIRPRVALKHLLFGI